ncbi:MAG: hypothetical protein ABJG41_12955 [Cyclobacteriaceae bacterium]
MHKLLPLLLLIYTSSCCWKYDTKSRLAHHDQITKKDSLLLPFAEGQSLNYFTSNGDKISFTVIDIEFSTIREFGSCADCCSESYSLFDNLKVSLISETPKMTIELSAGVDALHEFYEYDNLYSRLKLNIDNKYGGQIEYDSLGRLGIFNLEGEYLDTLEISKNTYYDVVKVPLEHLQNGQNFSVVRPVSAYYNSQGLLRIGFSDKTYFSLID